MLSLKLVLVSYLGSWPMNIIFFLSFVMHYVNPSKEYRKNCILCHLSLHNHKLVWEFIYVDHVRQWYFAMG
jgi:hypothetical protein